MVWCISFCDFDIDVDLLYQENLTIGQKMFATKILLFVLFIFFTLNFVQFFNWKNRSCSTENEMSVCYWTSSNPRIRFCSYFSRRSSTVIKLLFYFFKFIMRFILVVAGKKSHWSSTRNGRFRSNVRRFSIWQRLPINRSNYIEKPFICFII